MSSLFLLGKRTRLFFVIHGPEGGGRGFPHRTSPLKAMVDNFSDMTYSITYTFVHLLPKVFCFAKNDSFLNKSMLGSWPTTFFMRSNIFSLKVPNICCKFATIYWPLFRQFASCVFQNKNFIKKTKLQFGSWPRAKNLEILENL